MRSKIYCLLLLAVSSQLVAATSKCGFGEFTDDYLAALANTNTTVLYSQCKQSWGKSVLIIPVSVGTGESDLPRRWGAYYPELEGKNVLLQLRQTCTESFATVRFGNKMHRINVAASGGPQVASWTMKLSQKMEKLPFQIISPDRLKEIVNSPPTQNCE
jgi:hypothetical protein